MPAGGKAASISYLLARWVRELRAFSLEQAVHRLTGQLADAFGIRGRGRLAPGQAADLVLFDPGTVRDRADFQDPHQYATGIEYVFVNGRPVVRNGQVTGERPGQVLRRALP